MAKRSTARRDAIVAAAADLFAQRGVASVSMADLGHAVGTSGQAVYSHFPDKAAVLAEVLTRAVGVLAQAGPTSDDGPPAGGLRQLVGPAVSDMLEHRLLLATYLRERHRLDAPVAAELRRRERRMEREWAAVLRGAGVTLSPTEVRARLVGVLGAVVGVAMASPGVSPDRLARVLGESAQRSLLAEPVAPATAGSPDGHGWRPRPTRRAEILRAALDLFRRHGYHGVGIDQIGARVGMSGSAIYRHFESKSDILTTAYLQLEARAYAAAVDAVDGARSAHDALSRLCTAYVDLAVGDVELLVVTRQEGRWLAEDRAATPRLRDLEELWMTVTTEALPARPESDVSILLAGAAAAAAQIAQLPERARPAANQIASLMLAFLAGDVEPPGSTP